jgi:hypothetical protein
MVLKMNRGPHQILAINIFKSSGLNIQSEIKNIKKNKKRSNYIPEFNYCGPFTYLKYNLRNKIEH